MISSDSNSKNFVVCVFFIHTKYYNAKFSKKNESELKIQLGVQSIWTKTSLKEFGFKCIANKHESCNDSKCKCLCH